MQESCGLSTPALHESSHQVFVLQVGHSYSHSRKVYISVAPCDPFYECWLDCVLTNELLVFTVQPREGCSGSIQGHSPLP